LVLRRLGDKGYIKPSKESAQSSENDVGDEFLIKEREYIQYLEKLAPVVNQMEQSGLLSSEQAHKLAAPLSRILGHAFRFLLGAEMSLFQPEDRLLWSDVFWNLSLDSAIYVNFIEAEMEIRKFLREDIQNRKHQLSEHTCALLEDFLTQASMPRARIQYYATFVTVCI